MDFLEQTRINFNHRLIHFYQQVDCLFLDVERIIDLIVEINELGACETVIGENWGVLDLRFKTRNRRLCHCNREIKLAVDNSKSVLDPLWRLLPLWAKICIHRIVLLKRNRLETATQDDPDGFACPEFCKFIAAYYTDDIVLYDGQHKGGQP